jgi:hypothetical protein
MARHEVVGREAADRPSVSEIGGHLPDSFRQKCDEEENFLLGMLTICRGRDAWEQSPAPAVSVENGLLFTEDFARFQNWLLLLNRMLDCVKEKKPIDERELSGGMMALSTRSSFVVQITFTVLRAVFRRGSLEVVGHARGTLNSVIIAAFPEHAGEFEPPVQLPPVRPLMTHLITSFTLREAQTHREVMRSLNRKLKEFSWANAEWQDREIKLDQGFSNHVNGSRLPSAFIF